MVVHHTLDGIQLSYTVWKLALVAQKCEVLCLELQAAAHS